MNLINTISPEVVLSILSHLLSFTWIIATGSYFSYQILHMTVTVIFKRHWSDHFAFLFNHFSGSPFPNPKSLAQPLGSFIVWPLSVFSASFPDSFLWTNAHSQNMTYISVTLLLYFGFDWFNLFLIPDSLFFVLKFSHQISIMYHSFM